MEILVSEDITALKSLLIVLLTRISELESSLVILEGENSKLQTFNTVLQVENEEFRQRLNKNSSNSHKPPSSDGLSKKPAIPKTKGKISGGQVGHKGITLKMVEKPDVIIVHYAESCRCCQKTFSEQDVYETVQKRQVFDIPTPRLEVTEHQIGLIKCCGELHSGTFPEGVTNWVQYGNKIKGLSSLLNTDYRLPYNKIEQLFSDIYDCQFNESTAITSNRALDVALIPTENTIKAAILESEVIHCDETGMRVEGKLHWFHTVSTLLFTYLFAHAKRGKEALMSASSLIKDFHNTVVHDCWASYFDFLDCFHVLCNAHIVRELVNLTENGSVWASKMHSLLFELYQKSEKGTIVVSDKELWIQKYKDICQLADEEEPPPIKKPKGEKGKPKNSKGRNLLNRLVKYQQGILAFAFIENVPFTNNLAERDIRCLKVKQKVSNSFRTFDGATNYARIQGFTSSLRKHKMNVFQNIVDVLDKKTVLFSTK